MFCCHLICFPTKNILIIIPITSLLSILSDVNRNPVLSLGEDDPMIIQFELTNLGQSAYETKLYLTIPRELLYEGVDFIGVSH